MLAANTIRTYLAKLLGAADTFLRAYPNAVLPNEFGQYDMNPESMAAQIEGLIDSQKAMVEYLNPIAAEPDIVRVSARSTPWTTFYLYTATWRYLHNR